MGNILARSVQMQSREMTEFASLFGFVMGGGAEPIPAGQTFVEWCEDLGRKGLEVDGHPFDLTTRPALRAIYEAVPSTKAEGYNQTMAIMKGAQTGLTVLSFLLQVFYALKYEPVKVGIYYPDRNLAAYVSASRFMPVIRSIPAAHQALKDANNGGEGNVLTRRLGKSEVLFLWTSGLAATESFPLGVIVADEVQNMLVDDVERIKERMSASDVRFFFACSTAKFPGADIDFLFQQGDQRRFHTACRCDDGVILDEAFPACIQFNDGRWPEAPEDWVYVCPRCQTYIRDPQQGQWVRHNTRSKRCSYHFPQTLSPMVSPGEMIEAYKTARDLSNFFQRKLGRPWTDPTQVPITLEICERQAEAGMRAGIVWKKMARDTFLGLDQMEKYIVAIVLERLADGRMALIHAEFIYDDDPFGAPCDRLMIDYGVKTCVVEKLPNLNDAARFAQRHRGKVFLAGYGDLQDDFLRWGDQLSRSDKHTAADARTQYTVNLNQYRCMQMSLFRIKDGHCLFPDPAGLEQDILDKGVTRRVALLREVVFYHFTKTALVVEQDEDTRRPRAFVRKIAIDPHSSYAFMLANIAWARNNGTTMMILPDAGPGAIGPQTPRGERAAAAMPGLPAHIAAMMDDLPLDVCGRCTSFSEGKCLARDLLTGERDAACVLFTSRGS